MKPIYIISIIIVSLSISSWGGDARDLRYPVRYGLKVQWPAGFCEVTENCDRASLLNKFSVHGLSLYDNNGEKYTYCDGTDFDVGSVSDFLAEMHVAWPSHVINTTDEAFWKQQWDKYGKCAESVWGLKQTDYFKTALAFGKAFDILGLLNRAAVYPIGANYGPELIKDAIKSNLNAEPTLYYQKNKNSERVLTDIGLCLNLYPSRFIDCPYLSDNNSLKFASLASQLKPIPIYNAI